MIELFANSGDTDQMPHYGSALFVNNLLGVSKLQWVSLYHSLVYFSYISQKTGFDISCKLSLLGKILHEMSNPVFWEKEEK